MQLASQLADRCSKNRILNSLSDSQYKSIERYLEFVTLPRHHLLIRANQPISHIYFPLSGIVSTVAQTREDCIEVGLIGFEGLVGTPVILGTNRSPHSSMVQVKGTALRIRVDDLRDALANPMMIRAFGLYIQALMVQVAQTGFARATLTVEEQLSRWILMAHDRVEGDELMLTHEYLGMMLGVQRSTVTVAIQTLEGNGLIKNMRGRIIVVDRVGLMKQAGAAYSVGATEYERLMAEV